MNLAYYLRQDHTFAAQLLGVSAADMYTAQQMARMGYADVDDIPTFLQPAVARVIRAASVTLN